MRYLILILIMLFSFGKKAAPQGSIYDYKVEAIDGGVIDFSDFKGKKILIVNTASECGFTPQYEGLQNLYEAKKDELVIVGFPANNFGAQEPGSNAEIESFCKENYGVSFPMAAKVSVKGDDAHPMFRWLIGHKNPDITGSILWNFEKFLFDENGAFVNRWRSNKKPSSIL